MFSSHNLTKTTTSPTSSSSQVCNKFPYSWQPVYCFFQYTEANTTSHFNTRKPTQLHISLTPLSHSTSCSTWLANHAILSFSRSFSMRWYNVVLSMLRRLGLCSIPWRQQGSWKSVWSFSTLWMHVGMSMVVKIPIWILRSYDFTISLTQNDLNLSRIFAVVQDR